MHRFVACVYYEEGYNMEEKQNNTKQIEDEFLHSLAKTLCKTEHPELAFNSYSKALKVLYNEFGKKLKNDLLSFSQTTNINV